MFNGKELDRETNLTNFGARYLDMKTSLWLNVDPLAERGPEYSPYCYAMNNPMNMTDPDGRWPFPIGPINLMGIVKGVGDFFKGLGANNSTNKHTTVYSGNKQGDTRAAIVDKTQGRIKNGEPVGKAVVRFDKAEAKTPFPHVNTSGTNLHAPIPGGAKTLEAISKGADALNGLNKIAVPVAVTLDAIRIGDAMVQDGGIGRNTAETTAKVGGSWGGAYLGSTAGAEAGVTAGLFFGPAAEIASPVLGIFGGIGGGIYGAVKGEDAVNGAIQSLQAPHPDNIDKMTIICFIAGTKITMADFSTKNIENVKIGDLIQTYNTETNTVEIKEVLLPEISKSDSFVEIKFEDGTLNTNTLSHPYYVVKKGWCSYDSKEAIKKYNVEVGDLKEGDYVYKLNNNGTIQNIKIVSIKIIEIKQKTYNLSNVKDNHNFFANGILVHNRS
ncbi:RHS repeat-associated core domain-containing protein [Flavobacterium psychrophilum]|uniref:RHS repeat-associated core domain-containing protein n=1 Tax=Flavobacterium psychrophilum TaxID=96345 RepID=UPI0009C10A86